MRRMFSPEGCIWHERASPQLFFAVRPVTAHRGQVVPIRLERVKKYKSTKLGRAKAVQIAGELCSGSEGRIRADDFLVAIR